MRDGYRTRTGSSISARWGNTIRGEVGWGEEEGRGVRDRAGGEGLGHKVGWGCGDGTGFGRSRRERRGENHQTTSPLFSLTTSLHSIRSTTIMSRVWPAHRRRYCLVTTCDTRHTTHDHPISCLAHLLNHSHNHSPTHQPFNHPSTQHCCSDFTQTLPRQSLSQEVRVYFVLPSSG